MISYDDAKSFGMSKALSLVISVFVLMMVPCAAAKGKYINDAGLLGFAVWDSVGDYKDLLLTSIEDSMSIVVDCADTN